MTGTRTHPDKLAADTLSEHHPDGRLPIPIEPIAAKLGYTLLRNHHDGPQISFFLRDAAGRPHAGVNTTIGRSAQRFALAHALGHGLMHGSDLTVCTWLRLNEEPQDSAQATLAEEAGRVLAAIPVDQALGNPERRRIVNALAPVFGVSHEAITYRLVELAVFCT